jgi:hypothetical protein
VGSGSGLAEFGERQRGPGVIGVPATRGPGQLAGVGFES